MQIKKSFILILILIFTLLTSITLANNDKFYKDITLEEAERLININEGNDDFVVLDVRTYKEYSTVGYLKGSIQVNFLEKYFKKHISLLDKKKVYLLYCASGRRSVKALNDMKNLGFERIYHIKEGIGINFEGENSTKYVFDENIWLKDYEKAKVEAKKQGKPLLIYFSGTDWCGWCKKLNKEVIFQNDFLNYSKEKYVMLVIEFLRNGDKKILEKNRKIRASYNLKGVPKVAIINEEDELIRAYAYKPGGVENYIKLLEGESEIIE